MPDIWASKSLVPTHHQDQGGQGGTRPSHHGHRRGYDQGRPHQQPRHDSQVRHGGLPQQAPGRIPYRVIL